MLVKCMLCGYEWVSRVKIGLPKECSRCKRHDWNGQTNNIVDQGTTSPDSGELQRVQHEAITPSIETENGNK